ncbi:hypothetical protein [Salinarimonas chemoclinalis]|uniref:hypothetical protein n=1 Tax=Salinarimonas chemoclinalis TaxID=3241599 RepID=UPI0035572A4A
MLRAIVLLAALAAPALLLVACGSADREEARLCRLTLPVLNPEGARLAVLRSVRTGENAVRVDYTVEARGRARQRWVVCRFSPTPMRAGTPEIVALETDTGRIGGASLYLMRRFWLDTPDAPAADPGAG